MKLIVPDSDAAELLGAIPHSVHLCEPSGKIFGRFIPLIDTGDVSSMVFESTVTTRLKLVDYRVELREPSGNVLGHFYARISGVDMSEWELISPEITEEELARRMTSNEKRYTTAEVIAHLESL